MAEQGSPRAAYDRIAHLYDVDMARNMRFDDVGFYVRECQRVAGRVLELGCGNGRVLLELIARGVAAIGIDCSSGMLEQLRIKARRRGLSVAACQMDARALAFESDSFDVISCPYSLVTYMAGTHDIERLLAEIRRVAAPGGTLIVDAFVPRPVASSEVFSIDYRRPYRNATLHRSKRIASIAPGINRVERRYEILGGDGKIIERFDTSETIRVFLPDELDKLLSQSGFTIERRCWDYASPEPSESAQFYTVLARTPIL